MFVNEKQMRALGNLLAVMTKLGVRVHMSTLTLTPTIHAGGLGYRITLNKRLFSETIHHQEVNKHVQV